MNAKKCDRCGGYYTVKDHKSILTKLAEALCIKGQALDDVFVIADSIDEPMRGIKPVIDLCPECIRSLNKWYRSARKDEEGATDEGN